VAEALAPPKLPRENVPPPPPIRPQAPAVAIKEPGSSLVHTLPGLDAGGDRAVAREAATPPKMVMPPVEELPRAPQTLSGGPGSPARELTRTHAGLGPATDAPRSPPATLADTPEARAAIAIAKAVAESSTTSAAIPTTSPGIPTTTRETPGARLAAGKVIPFPQTQKREDEEVELDRAAPDSEPEEDLAKKRNAARKKQRQKEAEAQKVSLDARDASTLPSAEAEASAALAAIAEADAAAQAAPPAPAAKKKLSANDSGVHDEFFEQGEAGAYEGGPAHDRIPPEELEELVEVRRLSLNPEQEARRARNIRYVAVITGFALAVALVAIVQRARHQAPAEEASATTTQAAPPTPPAPVETAKVEAPKPDPVPPPPEPSGKVIDLEEEVAAQPPAEKPPVEKPVAEVKKPLPPAAEQPPLPKAPVAAKPPKPPVEEPPPPPPPATTPGGKPPTASFPTP
jgi:hypothetical protein